MKPLGRIFASCFLCLTLVSVAFAGDMSTGRAGEMTTMRAGEMSTTITASDIAIQAAHNLYQSLLAVL